MTIAADVVVVCLSPFGCSRGAIYVPEVGPMGDEFCVTIEEAVALGTHWTYLDGGWVCPECARRMGL